MYFATLAEMPVIQGLSASVVDRWVALVLLLAGQWSSMPDMLVIHGVMGTKKTVVFVSLVIIMATIAGYVFGNFF